MITLSRKALVAAVLLSASPLLQAGTMSDQLTVQAYRDFAENRGIFAPGATNIPIYNNSGTLIGTIPRMMNLDGVADAHTGEAALVGGQGFIATVAHDYNNDTVTFARRFGAVSGTPFYDSYKTVSIDDGWGGSVNYTYDYRVQRLDKIVTEATANAYLTDPTILNNMVGRQVIRAGSGTQTVATGPGTETTVYGAYSYLTGGTVNFTGEVVRLPAGSTLPPKPWPTGVSYEIQGASSAPGAAYNAYSFTYNYGAPSAGSPMNIGVEAGDSGSPSYVFNDNTGAWEWVAAGQSGGGNGYGQFSQMRSGNQWAVSVINGYDSPVVTPAAGGGTIVWNAPASDGTGSLTQGATSWNYVGLAPGLRGSTSTTGTAATNAQMNATRNLIFAGAGGTIQLGGSLDMGAGSLTFAADYALTDGGVNTRRLNTAGYILKNGATVTSSLTGSTGDEWRVFGDGKFVITGSGANAADLNVGGALLTELNRTGGAAARDVTINGGGVTVRLVGANQISGDVIFGHRGGTLDLYGNAWTADHITHLDDGANIANLKANTTSTLTFTGSGSQSYLGDFSDGGSLAAGLLNVNYNPGTPAGAVWNLSGVVINKGTFTVSAGEVRVAGVNTLHAGGFVDPNDWQTAVFNTGTVSVAPGATFTAGAHADVTAAISVDGGGAFQLLTGANHTGNIALNASNAAFNANLQSGAATASGAITGTGWFTKNGAGTLTLSGTNTFSGAKTVNAGTLIGDSLASLGDTTTNKWTVGSAGVIGVANTLVADVKNKLATGSTGTLAILSDIPTAGVNMGGYNNLFLGSVGDHSISTSGSGIGLTAWAGPSGNGWNLGGGGGALTMHNTLNGAGQLTVGNGANTGTVVLTGNNTYTGGTVVNAGMILRATSSAALGSGSGNVTVNYGATIAPGTGGSSVLSRIGTTSSGVFAVSGTDSTAYNFSTLGLDSLALGADGTATYSGTLTPGASGYKFGGNGALTVASTLSGANALSADGQGTTGGVTTLSGTNTFTGGITVRGGVVNGITGSHALRAGSAGAFGTGNTVSLQNGGLLDVNGYNASLGALSGVAGSALVNASSTASTVTIAQGTDGTMAGTIAGIGALNLVKTGAGILTLSGANTQTGTVAINAGAIRLGVANALGATTNTVTVASGGALDLAGKSLANAVTISGTGAGGLGALHNSSSSTTASTGAVTLAGNATISGAGTTAAISPGTINLAGNTLTVTNTRLNTGDSSLTNGNIVGAANSLFFIGGTQTGAGSTGTWTLGAGSELAVRDYNNTAMTNEKTLVLDGGKISNGNIDNGGGAQSTIANAITVNAGGGTIQANNTGFGLDLRFTGALAGSGALTITGGRAAEFQGATSGYTGAMTIASGSRLTLNGAANQSLSGVISGAGALTKSGATTLTLTGNNTYTGTTTINAGTLAVGNGGTSGSLGTGAVTNNGALAFNRSDTLTVANTISGSGSVAQNGTGTTVISGANTYAGGTTVNTGTLRVTSVTGLGTGAVTMNGGTLSFAVQGLNFNSIAGASLNTGAVSGGTFTSDFSPMHNTSGSVVPGNTTYAYTGKVYLTAGQWSFGEHFDDAAYVKVNNTVVVNNAVWNTATSGSITIATDGWYDIDARVWQGGGGVGPVSTNNWGPGKGVGVKTGAASTDGSLFAAFGADAAGMKLGTGGTVTVANAINLAANATVEILDAGPGGATLLSGIVSGTGALTKSGSGTLILGAANTYTGGTTVSSGTLVAANSGALGSGALAVNGGALDLNAGSVTTGAVTLSGGTIQNGTLTGTSYATSSGTVSAVLAGSGALTQSGSGTTTLSGNNTYTGGTTVSSGTLVATTTGALSDYATAGKVSVNSGGTLAVNVGGAGQWTSANLDTLRTNATFATGSALGIDTTGGALTYASAVSGNLGLTKLGSNTLTLTGANTYAGATSINAGTLQVGAGGSAGSLGSGAVTINGTLDFNKSGTTTVANALSGSGNIVNTAGVLVLTGANNFAGTTTLNGGAFVLNGTSADSASNAYVINSGGWLVLSDPFVGGTATIGSLSGTGGKIDTAYNAATGTRTLGVNQTVNGTYAGTMANAGSRLLGLAKTGSATLTLSGNNTYSGATTVTAGTLVAGHNSAFGTSAVTVSGSGILNSGSGRSLANAITINSGGTLAGASAFTGAVTINSGGTLSPGETSASGILSFGNGVTLASGAAYVWSITNSAPSIAGTDFDRIVVTGGTMSINAGATVKISAAGIDYTGAFWDSSQAFTIATKSGAGTLTGSFGTLDTSLAGAYSAEGSWSIITGGSGDIQALWTASSGLQGMSPQAVPEPSTYGLLGAGALAAAALVRRRKKTKKA